MYVSHAYTFIRICVTHIPIACTEIDGSGELVPDPVCLSSTVLQPSPSLVASTDGSQQKLGTLAITVGSVCAALAVLLLVVISVVIWILIKKHRQKEKEQQDISEPWSPMR